jgi:hypothetical protein
MVHRRAVLSVDHRRLGAEARDCIGNRVSMIKVAMTRTDEVFGTRRFSALDFRYGAGTGDTCNSS